MRLKNTHCVHVHLDEERYVAFLRACGATEEQIAVLVIVMNPQISPDKMYGATFHRPYRAHPECIITLPVPTPRCDAKRINQSLLHETGHFLQWCRGEDPRQYEAIEYHLRPDEIDARNFADAHKDEMVLSIRDEKPSLCDWWGSSSLVS